MWTCNIAFKKYMIFSVLFFGALTSHNIIFHYYNMLGTLHKSIPTWKPQGNLRSSSVVMSKYKLLVLLCLICLVYPNAWLIPGNKVFAWYDQLRIFCVQKNISKAFSLAKGRSSDDNYKTSRPSKHHIL